MYCQNCAATIDDNATRCPNCGAAVNRARTATQSVSFGDAVKSFFTHYADFSGRSRRSEYWWAFLFNVIVSGIIGAIGIQALSTIWSLVVLVPGIALSVRRLHDTGRSGWWDLICIIPLVGSILLLIWVCQDSAPDNKWGPDPKR